MSEVSPVAFLTAENAVLSEQSRREYLHAMGIVSWLPKNEPWQVTIQNEELSLSSEGCSATEVSSLAINENKPVVESTIEELIEPVEIMPNSSYPAANQFLKLVNWRNQSIQSESVKTVLIICRHKVDEPANSFSRANSPSQFMLDYIAALLEVSKSKGIDLNVQLAHLSQVGLTDNSVSFNEGLDKTKPDLVLILGDETLNQFVGRDQDVSQFRGKSITLTEKVSACVSYHPYTLIQEPALKPLAFEDLYQLVDCFNV